jgi:hypothetical protein
MHDERISGYVATFLFGFLVVYAFVREREELGCFGAMIDKGCDDRKSVYLVGTEPDPRDTPEDAIRKLGSILAYHEKGAIWKRRFLVAVALSMMGYVVFTKSGGLGGGWSFVIASMVFFSILYFEKNFENFHHHRELMRRGFVLLGTVRRSLGTVVPAGRRPAGRPALTF